MAGHTLDTDAVEDAIRLRLLTYRSVTGSPTLAERLAGGLHIGSPPDNSDYPYAVLRVLNVRRGDVDGPFFSGEVEVRLFFRPRSEGRALRRANDVAIEALVGFVDLVAGVHDLDVRDADVLPPFPQSADPEVIESHITFAGQFFAPAV